VTPLELARSLAERQGCAWQNVRVLQSTNALVVFLASCSLVIKSGQWPDSDAGMLREHRICRELHALGEPVPQPLGEPLVDQTTAMVATAWRYVDSIPLAEPSPAEIALALRRLHEALQQTTTELPDYGHWFDLFAESLFDDAEMANLDAEDRDGLRRAYASLRPRIEARPYAPMRLHGDPHTGNMVRTSAGLVILDLETVCVGPLEWDLASLDSGVADNYGDRIDPELLRLLREMNRVRVATWCFVKIQLPRNTNTAAAWSTSWASTEPERRLGRVDEYDGYRPTPAPIRVGSVLVFQRNV